MLSTVFVRGGVSTLAHHVNKGYPYGNVQNPYFSKSQQDFNKFGFLVEGENVENIYQSSPHSGFMVQKATIPGLWGPSCVLKTGGGVK